MRPPPSVLALLAALLVAPAHAQQARLIDAPLPVAASSAVSDPFAAIRIVPPPAQKSRLHAFDWATIAGGAALRVLDYTTTEKALAHPQDFHEDILPRALVESQSGFAAFQAATVGVNYLAYRVLVRHRLRSLAIAGQYLYDSAMLFQVASNYRTLSKVNQQRPR